MRNKLSVVIPVFNEEKTLSEVVKKVLSHEISNQTLEIIIVDDCSSDSTWEIAKDLKKNEPRIKIIRHEINLGKGASLRTGFSESCGQIVLIQDGDLEYDPKRLPITPKTNTGGKSRCCIRLTLSPPTTRNTGALFLA